ncbi:helix-turn-helix domain-containing protein [Crossiella cryophila]|uniref:Transcriptional regulator with XRE-family HTH domain n=1 Tax=Crossiella cryophila TaxID=43355 RepID=A0A7W7CL43_9PSEU|nr:helix-turn-helix transcriptional regulator [Crossiella cryophila]MBB4681811.1 transcriptional regulator with XRE-family HTH domain [Crossiella cryophila]
MASTPTRRKRRLGQFLYELRKRAGKNEQDFTSLTRKSQATLSRIESGRTLPGWTMLGAMLTFYGATAEERREGESLWIEAQQDSKRMEHAGVYNPKARGFIRGESDASAERTVAPLVIPGVLQTLEYALALYVAAHRFVTQPSTDRVVAAHAARSQLLQGPNALSLHALLDEACIRRVVGGPKVMAAQLRYLPKLGAQPNVDLQLIPFEAGAYGTMSGSIILGYEDDQDPDAVYLEITGGGVWVENEVDVRKYTSSFTDIAEKAALPPDRTAEVISEQAANLEKT